MENLNESGTTDEEREGEKQCRDLDETIRNRQLARKEAAAALEKRKSQKKNIEQHNKKLLVSAVTDD